MNEKIAVIGSNSFSGAQFVDSALAQDCEVLGVSRSPEPHPVFLPYKKHGNTAFTFYQIDINQQLDAVMEVIEKFKPAFVVNFAAQGMVAESWTHPEHWFRTNLVSTVMLHDRLRQCDYLQKYVHISTPEVYGNCQGLVKESTVYQPSTPYAVSKAAADMSLMSFFSAYKFPVIFTRAANVYGPGQQLYRIIPRAILYFLMGKKLQLHGGGHSKRSFIHIKDVCDATLLAARKAPAGEIFHMATTENITIRRLVEMIAKQLGLTFADSVEVVDDRLGKDAAYLLDSSRARDLGWREKVNLEQGIEETIAWVKSNYDILSAQPFDYIHKQ